MVINPPPTSIFVMANNQHTQPLGAVRCMYWDNAEAEVDTGKSR